MILNNRPATTTVSIRLSVQLLEVLREHAREQSFKAGVDINYADLIRSALLSAYGTKRASKGGK